MPHQKPTFRTLLPLGFILIAIDFIILGFSQHAFSQPAHTGTIVDVTLQDFSVDPNPKTAKAGWITFQAVNAGTSTHELVILHTDLNPANLPRIVEKDNKGTITGHIVNEEHAAVEPIDEIEEFPAGTRKKKKVFLSPGRYVLFCNVPEHYDKGMYATLNVVK